MVALLSCIDEQRTVEDDPSDGVFDGAISLVDGPSSPAPVDIGRPDAERPDADLPEPPDIGRPEPPDAGRGEPCAVRTAVTAGFESREPLGGGPFGYHVTSEGGMFTAYTTSPGRAAYRAEFVAAGRQSFVYARADGALVWWAPGLGDRVLQAAGYQGNRIGASLVATDDRLATWFADGQMHRATHDGEVESTVPGGTVTGVVIAAGVVFWRESRPEVIALRSWAGDDVLDSGFGIGQLAGGADALYFLSADPEGSQHVVRYDPVTEDRVVLGRNCEWLVAGGRRAAYTCKAAGGDLTLILYEDGEEHRIQTQAVVIGALAVDDAHLAWTAYAGPGAWCNTFESGRLLVTRGANAAVHDIAEVGSGCLCCGAYWPPGRLALGAGVAWNYAGDREAPTVGWVECLP